ncbi:NACHT domain-containing protein [Iningainema tapete]|uniref:NACHT domain-containing NTPase n=1 Tax=Iningainema tapete BLCC-T55 TaxID=2748662 RepID=A0A8J7BVY4_9CYAN|nr:NACHT domain-containing NTPase [Iningainema tapete]MBD2770777.1 NACHT domain-containing NTPase [Iningainema tapete BLCC-T55]
MQPLPRDFLTQMARNYQLSPEQEVAFVELFSGDNDDELEVAEALHISHNAFRTRMTGVYAKFSIGGKGPGKFYRLHNFLVKEYQKSNPTTSKKEIDVDALVQEVRDKIKLSIQERCGTMRVLDMTHPIGLNDIYTNVNILEKITGRRRLKIDELLQEFTSEDFERFGLGRITEKRVPGLEAVNKYPKLIILGKPGAGKTTFLKYLAIQCIGGEFHSHLVPIFITLKDFAEAKNEPGLLEYITFLVEQASCLPETKGAPDAHPTNTSLLIEQLLSQGRMLILLDGLDEVRQEDSSRVLKEIREFSDQYLDNYFVMTCRLAAQEYTFEKFTEVEVADFDNEQIVTFATKWFQGKAVKSENFIERLNDNHRIKELATSPLLLTLLCLTFEESGDFPANRSELYKEGLDALLKKWDAKRGIYRDQVYKKLSIQRKEDLLSKIALTTFAKGDYFFKQKVAEQHIVDYILNLPEANTDLEALQLDSERVLKSIEAQHGLLMERAKGIYSFSHLTFHEYFTAREIVTVKQSSEEVLQNLVCHITEKSWREVFLLAVEMLPNADHLLQLIKDKVDAIAASSAQLQQFLVWVNQKSNSVEVPYKSAAVKAFYFTLALDSHHVLIKVRGQALYKALDFDSNHYPALALDSNLDSILNLALDLDSILDTAHALDRFLYNAISLTSHLDSALASAIDDFDAEFHQSLQQLRIQLPHLEIDWEVRKQWWKAHGQAWTKKLRAVIIEYANIGHNWQFNKQHKELLQQYYDANVLLVECLNSDCYVSREVRQKIEDELLLPITKIEKRQQQIV